MGAHRLVVLKRDSDTEQLQLYPLSGRRDNVGVKFTPKTASKIVKSFNEMDIENLHVGR